ncbi:hypothetical protein FJ693_19085 [Georgenia yuyongxinii]|uniref:Uncharacterized protein n=1 Tax=Georgenia yuyongxinii TaxID=2589797 RepID=A0A552WK87_9MICO|nr:hypothetical protein FJ693_19085 [Georgenia yuyongxinii]
MGAPIAERDGLDGHFSTVPGHLVSSRAGGGRIPARVPARCCSVLGARCSVLGARCLVLAAQGSWLRARARGSGPAAVARVPGHRRPR